MIRRLYVHNFRCLQNFELVLSSKSSVLLIGNNGSGKTTVGLALQILQKIARGANRVSDLIAADDLGREGVAARFEIVAELGAAVYQYAISFELPNDSRELRVLEENLKIDGEPVYERRSSDVHLVHDAADFPIDSRLVALPIISNSSTNALKLWLARMIILRPTPSLIVGDSREETLQPSLSVTDFGAWFSGLLAFAPAAYATIDRYLKNVMPDLKDIQNPLIGKDARSLVVQFSNGQGTISLPFEDLSDGEKCFMICALVLASNEAYGPLVCFWDEPDNFLAPAEVGHFVLALRKAFQSSGQFIATSHNSEAIRRFSDENTLLLYRKNHLEPTMVRPLSEIEISGDLVGALVRGDLEP